MAISQPSNSPRQRPNLIDLLPLLLRLGAAAIYGVLKYPFKGSSGAPTFKQDVSYAVVRALMNNITTGQSQDFTRTTERVYEREAEKQQWTHHTVDIGSGAKGHWLGPPDAKNVLLFFHGGGYIGFATPGHLKYQFALQKAVRDAGNDISVFAASYTLAPRQVYPGQLAQAVETLRYLVEKEGRDPGTILISGDSAGAHLASGLLLHLGNPHPSVPSLKLASPLKGAVLISPWISFDTSLRSFTKNEQSDYLTVPAVTRASKAFIGPDGKLDEYAEPFRATPEQWKKVAPFVSDIMIWGGGGEIIVDSIRIFAQNIVKGFEMVDPGIKRVVYIETPRASHEEQIMNHTLRIKGKSEAGIVIEEWVNARL